MTAQKPLAAMADRDQATPALVDPLAILLQIAVDVSAPPDARVAAVKALLAQYGKQPRHGGGVQQ